MLKLISFYCLIVLSGCSMQSHKVNNIAKNLERSSPEQTLIHLQQEDFPERDYAQKMLNIGLLQLLSGNNTLAIEALTEAKNEMQKLQALSISETVAAASINETLRAYSGSPTDIVMLHNMLALAYIFNQNLSGARVEILQADVKMRQLASNNSLSGQLISANVLSGVIYELLDESDSALVSYKIADDLFNEHHQQTPKAVKLAILRLTDDLGLNEQHRKYQQEFSEINYSHHKNKQANQVFFIYLDGVVTQKREFTLMVPNYSDDQLIRISLPQYRQSTHHIKKASIKTAEINETTELIENIETLVREDLSDIYPGILLATTARAIAKYSVTKNAHKQNQWAGLIINLAAIVTESADVRSWNTLPSNIQIAYVSTDLNEVQITSHKVLDETVMLKSGKHLILSSSVTNQLFHFEVK